jgi:hypothetical protein
MTHKAKPPAKKPKATVPFKADTTPRVTVDPRDDHDAAAQNTARQLLSPAMSAVRAMNAAERGTQWGAGLDAEGAMQELRRLGDQVNAGDLSRPERMLITQAVTLEALFTRLTERAVAQSGLPQFEAFMRLGLKAQAQSRLALEALATLKHGPAILARNAQVNVAHGPQQVNNRATDNTAQIQRGVACAAISNIRPNGLNAHEQTVDASAATQAGASDQELAPVGILNRSKDRSRQEPLQRKRFQGRRASNVAENCASAATSEA